MELQVSVLGAPAADNNEGAIAVVPVNAGDGGRPRGLSVPTPDEPKSRLQGRKLQLVTNRSLYTRVLDKEQLA